MLLSRRAVASILLIALAASAARARADGELTSTDRVAPSPLTPAPVATSQQSPTLPKIEWRDVFWSDRYGRLQRTEVPFQNGRLLQGEDVYLALRRPDLAEAYRKRQEIKTGLGVTAGLLLGSAAISAAIAADEWRGGRARAAPVIGMLIGLILSGVCGIAGAAYPAAPIPDEELNRLVNAHQQTP